MFDKHKKIFMKLFASKKSMAKRAVIVFDNAVKYLAGNP